MFLKYVLRRPKSQILPIGLFLLKLFTICRTKQLADHLFGSLHGRISDADIHAARPHPLFAQIVRCLRSLDDIQPDIILVLFPTHIHVKEPGTVGTNGVAERGRDLLHRFIHIVDPADTPVFPHANIDRSVICIQKRNNFIFQIFCIFPLEFCFLIFNHLSPPDFIIPFLCFSVKIKIREKQRKTEKNRESFKAVVVFAPYRI